MAILKNLHTGLIIYPKPVHVFGRNPSVADTVLYDHTCSRMHCVLRWQAGHWLITDESTNGCFVNGKQIERSQSLRLNDGDTLAVSENPEFQWLIVNTNPPSPVIISDNGIDFIELKSLNLLPNEKSAECLIIEKDDLWFFEQGHSVQPMSEKFCCQLENQLWTFYPNYLLQETKALSSDAEKRPSLEFNVSRNEENVNLTIIIGDDRFNLGHKTHHYILLELARQSLSDNTTNERETGWLNADLLLHNLKINIKHLNIQIYRARESIREITPYWGQHLIERRRGEIRLHDCDIQIR